MLYLLVVIFLLYEGNDFFLLLVEILYTLFSHSFSGYLSFNTTITKQLCCQFHQEPISNITFYLISNNNRGKKQVIDIIVKLIPYLICTTPILAWHSKCLKIVKDMNIQYLVSVNRILCVDLIYNTIVKEVKFKHILMALQFIFEQFVSDSKF